MSSFVTGRAITAAVAPIDPLKAVKMAHERYNLADCNHGVQLGEYTFDQYNRQAHHDSLPRYTYGGCPSAHGIHHNLQHRINIENNIERPYIDNDLVGKHTYDTMGHGRHLQRTYTGGVSNNQGGWNRVNMSANNHPYNCQDRPPRHYTTDSSIASMTFAGAHVTQYNG